VLFSQDKQTVTLKMLGFKSFMHLNWPARYQSYRIAQPALQQPGTTVVFVMGIEVASTSPNTSLVNPSGTGTMKIVECYVA
jgi:hypothetical protein